MHLLHLPTITTISIKTQPLFQGLLVHYMKSAETDNLKWVDATTDLLKLGYAMRNTTNQTVHLLINDASTSNRMYSSKKAIATRPRQNGSFSFGISNRFK